LFDPRCELNPVLIERFDPGQLPDREAVARARLLIADLLRLGILGEVQTVEEGKRQTVGDVIRRNPPNSVPLALANMPPPAAPRLRTQYALTRYGVSFIRAVSPKHAPEN
jgi:hypothetical protein